MGRKLINMTGEKHGRLTVLSLMNTANGSLWACACDCGQPTQAFGHNLRTGNTTSCGCVRAAPKPERRVDLAGRRFGRLVAISRHGASGAITTWLCRCDCGTEKPVRIDHLQTGATISCGCEANRGPSAVIRSADVRARASVRDHMRRARMGVTTDWFNPEQITALLIKQHQRCANCLCPITAETMHKDHIVPLSRGGSNSIKNIQLLCIPCNRRKYNKDPFDFAKENGRLL